MRFQQRLVSLIDELLDNPPASGESFLLDGQAIVLEDYLVVRPERAAEVATLLRAGRLEAGPWYVLADELIPGSEALVRNLLVGRRVLRALRAESPPVLYCPDSFGHPAALPMLARGFGLPLVVLWRGYGGRNRWPPGDVVRWRAPNGSTVVLYHLPRDGYEFGSHLPDDEAVARERWARMVAELVPRSRLDVALVPNGADHHARQPRQHQAVEALINAASASGHELRASSLTTFGTELLAHADNVTLPEIVGELRDSYGYTWTLQGTFGTRAAQKRRNGIAERQLVRDAEPWAALARRAGAPSRLPLLVTAWKTLLQAHPHDTLCGCSIDAVAAAMDRRLDDVLAQAAGLRADALADLVGYDSVAAREAPDRWQPVVIVRNGSPRRRGGVALVELRQFIADVPVGPGSAAHESRPTRPARVRRLAAGSDLQVLGRRTTFDRIESPLHYPDNDLVAVTHAALWLDPIPGYGTVSIPMTSARRRSAPAPAEVRVDGRTLDNGLLRIAVDDAGALSLEYPRLGRRINSLVCIEDHMDRGDLYTPSIRGVASVAELADTRASHAGPLVGEIVTRWRMRRASSTETRRRTAGLITLAVALEAGSPFVRLRVDGTNLSKNHRLRIGLRTDVVPAQVWADAAFGPVRREPLVLPDEDRAMETAPATAPLHRYVTLFADSRGATLYSDGLAEYEATPQGELFITLLRAVGELSRNDLPERPGHAGWPAPTPAAQSQGPYSARLALLLHGGRTDAVVDEIERVADDVLLPLVGYTLRSALEVSPPTMGAELSGCGLAFSTLKESDDGEWLVARCVNLLEREVDGEWRFGFPVHEARLARLDETPLGELTVDAGRVVFPAAPRDAVTLLVR